MYWLRSRSSQVLPPSSERKSAERVLSIKAYTISGFDGAIATARRPQRAGGNPCAGFCSDPLRARAAVVREEESRARDRGRAVAAGAEGPALAAEIPQAGEE